MAVKDSVRNHVTIQLSGARTNKTSWFKFYCRDFLRDVLETGEDEGSP